MGGRLLNAGVTRRKLGPAEDIAATDHDRNLHALLLSAKGLCCDVDNFLHANAALAWGSEALARQLEHNAAIGAVHLGLFAL